LPPSRECALRAAVDVLAERGVRGTTVALVTERAHVLRSTFRRIFGGVEDCIVAALDLALRRGELLVDRAFAEAHSWREGMRASLLSALGFLDEEPQLARVVMVEALAGGPKALIHRKHVAEAFRERVVSHVQDEISREWPLASQALFDSVLGRIHGHLAMREQGPLVAQLGPLMANLLAPFAGERELDEEMRLADELARAALAERARRARPAMASAGGDALPSAVANPRAWRLRECLCFVGEHPGASNGEVGRGIGVKYGSQISSALSRLAEAGLATKHSCGTGKRNRWSVTTTGKRVMRAIADKPPPVGS